MTPFELVSAACKRGSRSRWPHIQILRPLKIVRAGKEDSTEFGGMAGQASLGGVAVAGKTGTAEGEASHRTHGWFVGLAPASNPRVIVLVFTPSGRGADAAQIAGELLAQSPLRQP